MSYNAKKRVTLGQVKTLAQAAAGKIAALTAANVGAVPTTRKVNGKALSADISLTASDVGARAASWMPTAANVGAVPTSRKVNGKALSADITLTASDVGAPACSAVTFSAGSWKASGSGVVFTVTAAQHGRKSGNFVYQVYAQQSDGTYKSGTWNATGVGVRYLSSGAVELTAAQAFAGKIVFL